MPSHTTDVLVGLFEANTSTAMVNSNVVMYLYERKPCLSICVARNDLLQQSIMVRMKSFCHLAVNLHCLMCIVYSFVHPSSTGGMQVPGMQGGPCILPSQEATVTQGVIWKLEAGYASIICKKHTHHVNAQKKKKCCKIKKDVPDKS